MASERRLSKQLENFIYLITITHIGIILVPPRDFNYIDRNHMNCPQERYVENYRVHFWIILKEILFLVGKFMFSIFQVFEYLITRKVLHKELSEQKEK